MKIYIKPEIVIIQTASVQILAGSTSLNPNGILYNAATQTETPDPSVGGDETHEGGDDLEAAKRLFNGGDPLWHGYSPWE
jgi:hypothetical protein